MLSIRQAGTALMLAVLLLAGCATKPSAPVPLAADYARSKPGRVGVAMAELPKPDTYFPGAHCLLCMATAAAMNSSLTSHTRTLGTDELKPLKDDLAKLLRTQGLEVVVLDEPIRLDALPDRSGPTPTQARKDFGALRDKHRIDRLLVVHVSALGFTRAYSAYIPNGAPRATMAGSGYLVNLASHELDWYEPISVTRAADGDWDEGPKYPGLTNAYFQVLEMGMDSMRRPFAAKP